MSKYVTHKHGLILGSDNVFFVIDRQDQSDVCQGMPEEKLPDGVPANRDGYRAIVWGEGPEFTACNTLNVFVRSFYQQLVWGFRTVKWEHPWEYKGETHMVPHQKTYPALRGYWEKWLNDNVGPKYDMWDTYTWGREIGSSTLFFKKRGDALKFIREIDKHLAPAKKKDKA